MKDKAFARTSAVTTWCKGPKSWVSIDDLIEFVADALKPVAPELGLRGVLVLLAKGPQVLKLLPSAKAVIALR